MDWINPMAGSCEHGNEPSGSMKFSEILEWLSDWQLLKKDSSPSSLFVGWFALLCFGLVSWSG
jgi:hypothetical protein